MSSNQQAARPRVSILVDAGGGVGEGGESGSGIGGVGVDHANAASATQGSMSPGSDDMIGEAGENPTPIPAEEGDVSKGVQLGVDVDGAGVGEDGVDRVTPREGEGDAVNVTRDDNADDEEQDDEEGEENGEDEDVADDESDYSYTYEDEEDGHYSGFLIPTDPVESNNDNAGTGNDDVNVVAEDSAAAGASARGSSSGLPRTISRAASGLSGTSSPIPETNPDEGARKPKWREPTRAAVNMSLRAEKEKTGGRRRLASDLYKIMMADTQEAGFSLEPCDEDSMEKWCIKLFGFDDESNLANDLLVCGMDHVELEMSFPEQYPFEPPFVRVVKPRFKRQTGFVMSGALCMELLTKDGWNPINDIESVLVSIRSLMATGDGRLQAAFEMGKEAYKKALAEAKKKAKSAEGKGKKSEDDSDDDDDDDDGDSAKRKRSSSNDDNGSDSEKPKGKGKPRVATGGSYTASEAQSAYEHLSNYHKKEGWDKNGWWSRKG